MLILSQDVATPTLRILGATRSGKILNLSCAGPGTSPLLRLRFLHVLVQRDEEVPFSSQVGRPYSDLRSCDSLLGIPCKATQSSHTSRATLLSSGRPRELGIRTEYTW